MGSPITYSCTIELKQNFPHLLEGRGIKVVPRPLPKGMSPDEGFKLVCSRGSGRVEICGTDDEHNRILFVIAPDHSFLNFWCKDMDLLKEIERTLLDNGAVCNDVIESDNPEK